MVVFESQENRCYEGNLFFFNSFFSIGVSSKVVLSNYMFDFGKLFCCFGVVRKVEECDDIDYYSS